MKKSGITFSQRFPLAAAVLFGIMLIAMALLFYRTTGSVAKHFREKVEERHHRIIREESLLVVERLHLQKTPPVPALVAASVKQIVKARPDFLYLMIFQKSADDNYFYLRKKLPLSENLAITVKEGTILREEKKGRYLKNGLTNAVVDPTLYRRGRFTWQHLYLPYTVKKKTLILQFSLSAATTESAIEEINAIITKNRNILAAASVIIAIMLGILVILFTQNYASLLTNLSTYMKSAAEGNLDLNINQVKDGELDELARSFNTLIEEMRDLRERDRVLTDTENTEEAVQGKEEETGIEEMTDALFKEGVAWLKEENLERAIACFLFIAEHRVASFGSYFNLGVAYAKQKNYNESLTMFRRAQEVNPHHEMTQKYIARVMELIEKNALN